MKKEFLLISLICLFLGSSCTTMHRSMREQGVRVEMYKNDYVFSEQFSASAKSTKILGLDMDRLFLKKTGNFSGTSEGISIFRIPIIGSNFYDATANYAIHDLIEKHPGYDAVFYPQFETKTVKPFLGIGFILKTTEATVTTRLAKIK